MIISVFDRFSALFDRPTDQHTDKNVSKYKSRAYPTFQINFASSSMLKVLCLRLLTIFWHSFLTYQQTKTHNPEARTSELKNDTYWNLFLTAQLYSDSNFPYKDKIINVDRIATKFQMKNVIKQMNVSNINEILMIRQAIYFN